MITIKLKSGREFTGQDLEAAKTRFIEYHIDRGIAALKIDKIFSVDDEDEIFDEDEFNAKDISEIFEELEEEIEEYRNEQTIESEGLRLAQGEFSIYD